MNQFAHFYEKLPIIAQNWAVSAYGFYWHWLRFGGNYKNLELGYLERDSWDKNKWRDYQIIRLQQLLKMAYEKVPYYQRTWSTTQKRAAAAGVLQELPLLEKDPIRNNPLDFIRSDQHPFPRPIFHTSGTTGTPIVTRWTISELRASIAVREIRSANWAGVSFMLPRATFSGRMVEPDPNSRGPFHRYNSAEKQVYFSAFHLRPDTAHQYVEALHKHNVQWMTGYAVSFYLLAKFILEEHLQVPALKAVITTSENLTDEYRDIMQRAYGCRVYEEYGTVEHALFASECERGKLHVSPDVGIVEIIRPDGSLCEPNEAGEVVTTCLTRTYQPFIRYHLGDLAAWDPIPCQCGRQMPIIKEVVGRIEDVVVGPDGRQMVRFHGIFVHQPHVREGQIIQNALDHIHVKIVPADGFGLEDEQEIIQRVRQRLGDTVSVTVEQVDAIPRTKAGKFKAVISNLRQIQ